MAAGATYPEAEARAAAFFAKMGIQWPEKDA